MEGMGNADAVPSLVAVVKAVNLEGWDFDKQNINLFTEDASKGAVGGRNTRYGTALGIITFTGATETPFSVSLASLASTLARVVFGMLCLVSGHWPSRMAHGQTLESDRDQFC
jgi:hypothetical protein